METIGLNRTVISVIGVAGKGKSDLLCDDALINMGRIKTIFAVRTLRNASDLMERLLEKHRKKGFKPESHIKRSILKIDSEEVGLVKDKLEQALRDDAVRIIVITHRSLLDFDKWDIYGGLCILNIDELPTALELAYKTFTDSELDIFRLRLSDAEYMQQNPSILQKKARELHNDDSFSNDLWSSSGSNFWRILAEADATCIHSKVVSDDKKIGIAAVKESSVFKSIGHFHEVRLATMLLEGSLFETIGLVKEIEFIHHPWSKPAKRFEHDDRVTLVPLTDHEKPMSTYRLESVDQNGVSLLKRVIAKALEIPYFKQVRKPLLYISKGMKADIGQWGLDDRFDFMPYDTHGHRKWQDEKRTHFILLQTFQWNPIYNECGQALAKKLGMDFSTLKESYVVSQQLEPLSQAATRGALRSDQADGPESFIAVADQYTVDFLKRHVMPNAKVDKRFMLSGEIHKPAETKPVGRPKGWRGVGNNEGLEDKNSQWLSSNIGKISDALDTALDPSNIKHVQMVMAWIAEHQPNRACKRLEPNDQNAIT